MKCPACGKELTTINTGGVEVDVCQDGCGGIWFDTYEFKKFDEPYEQAGEKLLDVARDPDVSIDLSKQRNCPRCGNTPMMRHFYSVKKQMELDECPSCGGIWLDTGELSTIRSFFKSEEEKRAAAEALFDDLFGPQLASLAREQANDLEKARRFANMFKYICPSYYISGKQGWGAF